MTVGHVGDYTICLKGESNKAILKNGSSRRKNMPCIMKKAEFFEGVINFTVVLSRMHWILQPSATNELKDQQTLGIFSLQTFAMIWKTCPTGYFQFRLSIPCDFF